MPELPNTKHGLTNPAQAVGPALVALLWCLAGAPAHAQAAATAALPSQALQTETVAKGLENPWAVAFLPGGRFLVTERPGRMRVVQPNGTVGAPLAGLPAVAVTGQGGLLDVATDSAFATNRHIYFCYSEPGPDTAPSTNSTALARARLSDDLTQLEDVKVLFSQKPKVASGLHFGCRIVEAGNTLFLTLGERGQRSKDAQTLDNHHGKVVRLNKDGSIPADNPFAKPSPQAPAALPEIWSYGHRNPQGATLGPDGKLWTHEHGPQGGDEINLSQPSQNFGWPEVTFGEKYGGGPVGEGLTSKPGMTPPLHHWTPSIAPSGMVFVTSQRYGADWKNNLLVGSLKFHYLARLQLDNGRVVRETRLLEAEKARIRDVRQGPDGFIYVLTDQSDGRLLRLLPPK